MNFDVDKRKRSLYSKTYSRVFETLESQTSLCPKVDSTEICSMQANTEYNLPEGCEIVEGTNLCVVPFNLMALPDDVEYDGKEFTNPRNNTDVGYQSHVNDKCSKDLRDSIASHGLLNPLAVRFVTDKYGREKFMVIGGERRFRAISKLIDENVLVSTGKNLCVHTDGEYCSDQLPAKIVFKTVPCQVYFCQTDQEAITIAWAENKNRKDLTDGIEIAEVKSFRRKGYKDLFITNTLQRDHKWLETTDKLLKNLDDYTLSSLMDDKITRDAAIKLLKIENVNDRKLTLNKANKEVQKKVSEKLEEKDQEIFQVVEFELESARDEEWHAVGEEERRVAAEKVKIAEERVEIKKAEKERTKSSPVTAKDINKVVREPKRNHISRDDAKVKSLKDKVNNQFVQYLQKLIQDNGVDQPNDFVIDPSYFEFALRLFRDNHLAGDKDYVSTIIGFAEWLEDYKPVG